MIRLLFIILFFFESEAFADLGMLNPTDVADLEWQASQTNYASTLCHDDAYFCEKVKPKDTWASLWPDFQERENIMRLNRSNIALKYREWVAIPKDMSTPYMDLSPLPSHMETHHKKLLFVDLEKFAFGAYDTDGNLIYWGPASGGATVCNDSSQSCETKRGEFQIYRLHGKDCISHEYPIETHGGAAMPYCMYYYKGFAIHASTLTGFMNRSKGCVRVFYDDAKWLYERFVKYKTAVIVR
jgi:L,D-transpeptidase ErfK/SrfK